MKDDEPSQPDHAQLAAEQRRKEMPGTIGCVSVYGVLALIGCVSVWSAPQNLIQMV